jgi:predicted phage-related endonuclease
MDGFRYTVEKPEHGSQEWLTARWKDEEGFSRITASVASAVHGQNPYMTTADLAIELLSETPPAPKKANAAMERGNRFEPTLLKWYADMEGVEVLSPEILYAFNTDDNSVRLLATLDGITPDGIPVEIKTSNKMWTGQLSNMWYWQGIHQAICADSDRVEWGILDSSLEFHRYTQIVTSDEKQNHIQACREFLGYIDQGVVPPNAQMSYENASALNPASSATKELPQSFNEVLEQLETARKMKAEATSMEEEAKTAIAMALEGCEVGSINGDKVVTWKVSKKSSFDTTRFQSEHPALAEKFIKQTEYRTIRTTKRSK